MVARSPRALSSIVTLAQALLISIHLSESRRQGVNHAEHAGSKLLQSGIVDEHGEDEPQKLNAGIQGEWGDPWPNKPDEATHSSRAHPSQAYRLVHQAFSPQECANITLLPGKALTQREPATMRAVELRAVGAEGADEGNRWMYSRVWGIAGEANQQGWKWEELTGLPDLQLAVYHEPARASDGQSGQFDWHRDEETLPRDAETKAGKFKLITVVIQLQSDKSYTGGDLQVGEEIVSRTQGDAIMFPGYSLSKVHPVATGTRVSLVAYIRGRDPAFYWERALQHYRVLGGYSFGSQYSKVDRKAQTPLALAALGAASPLLLLDSKWDEAKEAGLLEVEGTEALHPAGDAPRWVAGNLAKAHVRLAMAYTGLRQLRVALEMCEKAHALDPGLLAAQSCAAQYGGEEGFTNMPAGARAKVGSGSAGKAGKASKKTPGKQDL